MSENEAREVNVPLLRKAVEWAEAEAAKPAIESRWMQSSWINLPRYVAQELAEDALDDVGDWSGDTQTTLAAQLEPYCGTAYCIAGYVAQSLDARYAEREDVGGVHVAEFASKALGIDHRAASMFGGLYDGGNSIADVRRIAEDLAGERL